LKAMQQEKLMKPPTDCLSPITEDVLIAGLKKVYQPEFVAAVTRPPAVYRGNPFQIEAAVCYGGPVLEQSKETSAKVARMANRVPLLYMAGACASTEAVLTVNWKSYNIQQTGKSMPQGPIAIVVHIASGWVPFTSESKDAIASYSEILEEMRLALQECGRRIGKNIRGKVHAQERAKRLQLFEKYVKRIGESVADLSDTPKAKVISGLEKILKKGKEQFLEMEAKPEEENGKAKEESPEDEERKEE
jgi:DNA topoisomerase VI subunit B